MKGMDYLYQKGFTDSEIANFGLVNYCNSAFYGISSSPACRKTIQYFKTLPNQEIYNNTILIPIFDTYGTIKSLAFRKLNGTKPKFMGINGYKKNFVLYGLNLAKEAILKADEVFLVEGYWEVIALHKHGIKNVVALCGCSISDYQIALLTRFTKNFRILLDPDTAGIEGSKEVATKLKKAGCNTETLKLETEIDLDEYLNLYGIERFNALCGNYPSSIQQSQK